MTDVVVFGATAAGVMAAAAARGAGAESVLVEPSRHIGGMVARSSERGGTCPSTTGRHPSSTRAMCRCPCRATAIPYRALTPRREDAENVLVAVCVSASHVAFGSVRTEPTLMALGQAAGLAAAQAARRGLAVQDVDVEALRPMESAT